MMEQIKKILERYSLRARNTDLYTTAFTHRSVLNESRDSVQSNERLEFLGDSVLSLITSTYLYSTRGGDAEGDLTNLRAFLVKTDSLAKISEHLGLGALLKLSRGEELGGGRVNTQLLANTYEALLGAIYLDLGFEAASLFVHQTLIPYFQEDIKQGPPKDSKSQLQEVVQSKYQQSPHYKILSTQGPDHAKQFEVGVFVRDEMLGKGVGNSKQTAEELAAKQATTKLVS